MSEVAPHPGLSSARPEYEGGAQVDVADPGGLVDRLVLDSLRRLAGAALDVMGLAGEVRVRLVDDAEMSRAHDRYTGDPSTTDVLTFDLAEGGSVPRSRGGAGRPLDVDVLVCVDEGRRQSGARGHALERELLLYIVHAVLHCAGFDDRDAEHANAMHAEEDRVLEAIGVGVTFARAAMRDS